MKKSIIYIIAVVLASTLATSCVKHSPKPRGYFRIELKETEYSRSDSTLPYSFEYPKNLSLIVPNKQDKEWFDIVYPRYNARIYFSYKPVNKNFREISEDSRNFVYKHAFKADAIGEQFYENAENKTYGILYEIKGNTASAEKMPVCSVFFANELRVFSSSGCIIFSVTLKILSLLCSISTPTVSLPTITAT